MTDEITVETIKKTQESLSKFIKKPSLTEKLLKKPPFRFLHDIVTNVINETGFLKGLYTQTEMQSENIKERDTKIAFLQKLIDVMKIISGAKLTARPSKIIAGLEPTKTNELLQNIGLALEKKLDSSKAVSRVTGIVAVPEIAKDVKVKEIKKPKEDKNKTKKPEEKKILRRNTEDKINLKDKIKKPSPRTEKENRHNSASKNEKSSKERIRKPESPKENGVKESPKESISNEKASKKERENENSKKEFPDVKVRIRENTIEIDRPKTSENKSEPNLEPKNSEPETNTNSDTNLETKNLEPNNLEPKNLEPKILEPKNLESKILEPKNLEPKNLEPKILEHKSEPKISEPEIPDAEPEPMISKVQKRPSTSLRPPSVRPSSARPGAPRLKDRTDTILPPDQLIPLGKVNVIVENFNEKQDDEETVVLESQQDFLAPPDAITEDIPAEKGHLVSQILEQIGEQPVMIAPKAQITWEDKKDGGSVKLKQSIQTLTRAANPLGKLLNFLHEDVDSMQTELKMWISINEKLRNEIKEKKRQNEDSMKPLYEQLSRLEADIVKQNEMMSSTQANILRNQQKIKTLLTRD